jgi:disulfide bond formation protein DsbB
MDIDVGGQGSTANSEQNNSAAWNFVFLCWLVATVSTLGSLFFSEVMELPPCVLCWYQRIFMFPLAIVLTIGLFPFDKNIVRYALPLAAIGWAVALYHYLLYSGFIPENLQPCSQDVPCSKINLELFGFITIPLLSLFSFSIVVVLLMIAKKRVSK